jgi:autotransporter-associated beta strand protein
VAAGNNNHTGPDVVDMGNLHFADNDSLNVGPGLIIARGGAVGVDTGVANNSTFLAKIDPTSRGGLMLAASDAAANLNFTSTLANAANMTVAAPETGLTFTGSITPAANKYQLGGGTGTLTLPNAQLSGANSVEVRNGGTVQLLGDNTYTGSTTILTKYTSTSQAQAAVDSNDPDLSVGGNFYREVAPTLAVDKLSNGGQPSSIGSASSDAANLFIQGSTLKYVGAGDSTNRLFTIGTGGATIDSSGTGAVVFSNTGALGRDDVEDKTGDIDDFTGSPNELYNLSDTSDVVVGMTVTDPDAGGIGPPPIPTPIIPAGTTVTGISDDGRTIGLSNNYGFYLKAGTRLVFGTTPRTLTLAGSNGGANTIASQISNSAAGGVVGVTKTGAGTWLLSGNNNYTGPTTVQQGTLGAVAMGGNLVLSGGTVAPGAGVGTMSVGGTFTQSPGAALAIELASASSFDVVNVTGAATLAGVVQVSLVGGFNPAVGSQFDILTASSLNIAGLSVSGPGGWSASAVGNTLRLTRTALGSAVAATIPEPNSLALAAMAAIGLGRGVRRRAGRG